MERWLRTGSCRKLSRSSRVRLDEDSTYNDEEEAVPIDPQEEESSCSPEESSCVLIDEQSENTDFDQEEETVFVDLLAKRFCKRKRLEVAPKIRHYDPTYIEFGFVETGDYAKPDGMCVICRDVLKNSSLNPSKLRRHLVAKHPNLQSRPKSFFQLAAKDLRRQQGNLVRRPSSEANEVSVRLAYKIGRAGEGHTIGERLIKPCLLETAKCLWNERHVKQVEAIPLSNNTIRRRIEDVSSWIESQVCDELRSSPCWAFQLDESTDVAGLAILLAFVRYVHSNEVKEELLFCKALSSHTTGEAIFDLVEQYFKEHDLTWTKCVNVCSDGARAMTASYKGFVSRVKDISPETTATHCILHREALAVKRIPKALKGVLDDAVKVVNYIKSRPLQSRLFKILCDEMGSNHSSLLLHTEARWLSRGRVLNRVFELRDEIVTFGASTTLNIFDKFRDTEWLQRLAYLADVFKKLNDLNSALQGKQVNVFQAEEKIEAMKKKVQLWAELLREDRSDVFPTLHDFLNEKNLELDDNVRDEIIDHLIDLRGNLEEYFPTESMISRAALDWIKNPFAPTSHPALAGSQNDQLVDLQHNSYLQERFSTRALPEFWAEAAEAFPDLSRTALRVVVPFVTTYLCESGFSVYASTKNKYRNKLDAENDMRIQLSERTPDFREIASSIQLHPSH